METERHPLDQAIDARRQELGLRWRDLYNKSVSQETMRKIRYGLRDDPRRSTDTERRIEDALGWAHGSIQAVRDGGEPTLADSDDLEEKIKNHPDLDDEAKQTLLSVYRAYRDKPLDARSARLVRD